MSDKKSDPVEKKVDTEKVVSETTEVIVESTAQIPQAPAQKPEENDVPQEKREEERKTERDTPPSRGRDFSKRSTTRSRSRTPKHNTKKEETPTSPTSPERSILGSRSRSLKVVPKTQPPRSTSVKSVMKRSTSLPPVRRVQDHKNMPSKILKKENPRQTAEDRYSPNVNNVVIFRQHPIRKELWERYPPDEFAKLKEHSDKTKGSVYCCSKCLDFLPKNDLMMWQDCERRWPNHSASCHPESDFYVSPTGKPYMKNPVNNSLWWPLKKGQKHFDELIQVIKELSKSLPVFCLPDLDGNIFSVTSTNLIGCMRCGHNYKKQVIGSNNGWDTQVEEHYKEAHPHITLPTKEEIVTMWNDTIIFKRERVKNPF